MFRRRTQPRSTAPAGGTTDTVDGPSSSGAGPALHAAPGDDLVAGLTSRGWVLPRGLTAEGPPHWTLVGTVASPTATAVDPAGLVVGEGWSLDWWIGADDRWHLPAREAAVRQQLLDDAPVVETMVRIPGGDAVHRAYGVRSARQVGDEWVVVEIENATPVPFAVALVIRPMVADGVGAVSSITIEPVDGGRGRDVAHLVRVDGRPALVLPRRPARVATGDDASGDVVHVVTAGEAGLDLATAQCPDGLATTALVFPVPHTAVLRVAIPVGQVGDEAVAYPSVLPEAASVASGWEVHRRGPRFEIPEVRLAAAVERARAQLQLAHDGRAVRRDGHRMPDLEPGATEVLLGAFDLLDRPADVGLVVARWSDRLVDPPPEIDALFLTAVSHHWLLHRMDAILEWMLPEVAAAVERLDRADRRGRLTGAAARRRASAGLAQAAEMLERAGQPDAGGRVLTLARRIGADAPPPQPATAAEHLLVAAARFADPDPDLVPPLDPDDHLPVSPWQIVADQLGGASATSTWPGPGPSGRPIGHDLVAAAALITAVRHALVTERPDGLALVPDHPDAWYGGKIELHDAPTTFGRISFAIRWHGTRPALLWELEPHDGIGPVTITAPGLDPTWSTTELRGDALLAEVTPPAQSEAMTLVSEHPVIDPTMRRPGSVAEDAPPAIPDGGSFS